MRAIDIYLALDHRRKYIDTILASDDYNPILLNDFYIIIELDQKEDILDMVSLLTRQVVLNRARYTTFRLYDPSKIYITILEAIDFIQTITPPILKAKVNKELKSIDYIIEYLKIYLLEDPDTEYKFYILRNNTHLQSDFKTGWEISDKIRSKAAFMRKNISDLTHPFFILEYLENDVSTIIDALKNGYSYDHNFNLSMAAQGILVFPSIGGKINDQAIKYFLDLNISCAQYVDIYRDKDNTIYLQLMSYGASDAFLALIADTYKHFIK